MIQTCLEAYSVFLGKTKIKADTKLTVVMCCQLLGRKRQFLAATTAAIVLLLVMHSRGEPTYATLKVVTVLML